MTQAQLSMLETLDQRVDEKARAANYNARLAIASTMCLRWPEAREAFIAFFDHTAAVRWAIIRREQFIEYSGRFPARA